MPEPADSIQAALTKVLEECQTTVEALAKFNQQVGTLATLVATANAAEIAPPALGAPAVDVPPIVAPAP